MLRFTLQRDPCGRLSACADGPSGRDVHCRVHVRVGQVSAGYAPEDRLALTVLRCAVPTDAAGLRRVRRVYSLNPARSLAFQPSSELAPAVGQNASAEPGFGAALVRQIATWLFEVGFGPGASGQLRDPQVLDADDIESSREVGAGLFHPVLATVSGAGMQLCDRRLGPTTAVGAAATAGQATLQVLEPCLLTVRQTGTRQELTGRQRRRDGDTAVHANNLARTGSGDRLRDDSKREVPPPRSVARDAVRLRRRNRTGKPEAHPADLRHVDRRPSPVQLHHSGRLTSDDPESLAPACFTPGRTPVEASVEVPDSLVEVPQRLLLHGLRPGSQPTKCGPCLGQLPCLPYIARRRTFVARPHRPLLKRQVPHVPGVQTLLQQRSLLRGRRVHPEPGHTAHPISRNRQFLIREGRQSRHIPELNHGLCSRRTR